MTSILASAEQCTTANPSAEERIAELEDALIYIAEENALLCDKMNTLAAIHAEREAEYRQVIEDLQVRLAFAQMANRNERTGEGERTI